MTLGIEAASVRAGDDEHSADPATRIPEPSPSRSTDFLFQESILFLTVGVFIVCCGYALSRASKPGAMAAYFTGDIIIALAPLLFLYLNRIISTAAGLWMSLSIGIATFVITLCYSPSAFAFSDEFQHSFTARSILQTGHLFHSNPTLAVSPQFPGLEIVTAQLSTLSGLSLFASGTIIAGTAHVILTGLVFCLAREFGLSARAAAFAVIIFTTGYTYQSFLSYFAYETFAVPFLLAALVLIVKMLKSTEARKAALFGGGALVMGLVTTVSHHVTSYFLAAMTVGLILSAYAFSPRWRRKPALLFTVLGITVAFVAYWDLAVATGTFQYLRQIPALLFGSGTKPLISSSASSQVAAHVLGQNAAANVTNPLPLRIIGDLGVAVVALIIPFGAWTIWRHRERFPLYLWITPLIATIAYYALLPIFLLSPGGNALVGRGQVLMLVPAGFVAAVTLDRGFATRRIFGRNMSESSVTRVRNGSGSAIASLIVIGGVTASYPPYSGKLPAPYNVSAYTRSVDARTIAAGTWMTTNLGATARVAGGHTQVLTIAAIAGIQGINGGANLFETESFTAEDARLVKTLNVGFILGDYRLTTEVPAGGFNFDADPLAGHYSRPLPRSVLTKFDHLPGVSRIFDDGVIVIYDLRGSRAYRLGSGT